ncbi:MAG: siroheme synthase CysG [Firmicutes bacterium]|nr:siroheme synthase CysG [Bacillota bacterium]
MGYFPFFIDIKERNGLIIGGGRIAAHKVEKLLPFEPRLMVVAPDILPELLERRDIICHQRTFSKEDLSEMMFVIAASDDISLNSKVAEMCMERGIPVNVVDNREECSFLFPALVKEGKLTVGISTGGASPQIASELRSQVAQELPCGMEQILDYLFQLRKEAKMKIGEDQARSAFLKKAAMLCMEKNRPLLREEEEALHHECNTEVQSDLIGCVTVVGAGCGAYDLITVRGMNAVRKAQVLVYDDLIDRRLLDFAAESCERLYVGKRSGKHSMPQEEINRLLIEKAKQGKRVVRLKGGDPFVFGRGKEEVQALTREGIEVQVVPGISSAIGVPSAAGIPVTHRELSESFHVITGHTARGQDSLPEDMEQLASLHGTLVFLMGLGHLEEIAERLVRYGKEPDTPAAVVHGSFDGNVRTVRGTLRTISERVRASGMEAPAVIVVGETAGMK